LCNNPTSSRHARLKLRNPGERARWSLCSPLRNFFRLGSVLRAAPVDSLQIGTRSSERPFALLKRLPASGPPFQGQSSWPIPSAQRFDFAGPVRSLRSSTLPGLPHIARIQRVRPVARFPFSGLDCSSTLHSRLGLSYPSRSKRSS
jgi:hypothetical protein